MSSFEKDPLEKQDTPSESSESQSHSDSDVDEAEEDLENLKIEERQAKATKDVSGESKPSDFAEKGGALTRKREPTAGPSGLQTSPLKPSGETTDPEAKVARLTDPKKEQEAIIVGAEQESLGAVEDTSSSSKFTVGTSEESKEFSSISEIPLGSSDISGYDVEFNPIYATSSDSSSFTGIPCSSFEYEVTNDPPTKSEDDVDQSKPPVNPRSFMYPSKYFQSSSSKRQAFATESANTSSDLSEMRSEMADISAGGSLYLEAQEHFVKEPSPSYASALSRQASEASETSISEIQEDPSLSGSSSISISTPTSEEGNQAYINRLKKEAEQRGSVQESTSSAVGSADQDELFHRQAWQSAGERGFYRNDADDPNRDLEPQPTSEPSKDSPISGEQQIQNFGEENKEQNVAGQELRTSTAGKMHAELTPEIRKGSGSTSKRRTKGERGVSERLRSGSHPDSTDMKLVAGKSSSESSEPKSSSSDDLHRKESRETKSLSRTEFSKPMERRTFQRPGNLRRMKHPTISSRESSIPEDDEECESSSQEQGLEITSDEPYEAASESSEPSASKPAIESSDQAYGATGEGTSKEHGEDLAVSDFERNAGKSKRAPKLSNSPQSDEKEGSSPPKAKSRPKKKARSDNEPARTRRTRRDPPSPRDDRDPGGDMETEV